MTGRIFPMMHTNTVQNAQANLESKLRRFKTLTTRGRIMSVDDYIEALKYWDEEVTPAADEVRDALVEMHNA